INYAADMTMVAVARDDFSAAFDALTATHEMIAAIKNGLPAGQKTAPFVAALMTRGADLRYVDPDAAQSGRSIADLMVTHQAHELLRALRSHSGVHSLNTKEHHRL